MAQGLPAHAFFLAGRNAVDPETKRAVIETQARIDEVDMRVICMLRANFFGFDLHRRLEPAFRLFFGEAHRFHKHPVAIFRSKYGHNHL